MSHKQHNNQIHNVDGDDINWDTVYIPDRKQKMIYETLNMIFSSFTLCLQYGCMSSTLLPFCSLFSLPLFCCVFFIRYDFTFFLLCESEFIENIRFSWCMCVVCNDLMWFFIIFLFIVFVMRFVSFDSYCCCCFFFGEKKKLLSPHIMRKLKLTAFQYIVRIHCPLSYPVRLIVILWIFIVALLLVFFLPSNWI